MATTWNREYLKNWMKSVRGLDRDTNDGLLTNTLLNEIIETSLRMVSYDCNLLPRQRRFPLIDGQWEYPMPDGTWRIRAIYRIDSDGTREPLTYIAPDKFMNNRDVDDDTATDPVYYSYPVFEAETIQFYALAPPIYDYVEDSYVTTASIRTVIDSGINFGLTLSGTRVSPGDVVQNLTDGSYGYVGVLDIITNTTTGTATAGTGSATLEDTTKNFTTLGVEVGDIICTPSTGAVTSYAFVTAVGTDTLTYEAFRGATTTFASGDTYKVGKAQEISMSTAAPHRGMRDGADNTFDVGSALATITGTTFTATTVTGSDNSGAVAEAIAIASGGSHGTITAVTSSTVLTVDKWIGGIPAAGETVTVKVCDNYQVETRVESYRSMWIAPTPSASDTVGEENILVIGCQEPHIPDNDYELIEIPREYERVLKACLRWQMQDYSGIDVDNPGQLHGLQMAYENMARKFSGDIYSPPITRQLTTWGNRHPAVTGVNDQTPNGLRWTANTNWPPS